MSSRSLISSPLTATNSIQQYSWIKPDLSESPLQQNKPIQQNKMVIKKIMKKIDLRCRCCDNNPLRKSSESSENSCRFFARGIIPAQVLALQFANFPGSWQRGIVAAPQWFSFSAVDQSKCATLHSAIRSFLLGSPKLTSSPYQWMSFFYWTLFIMGELYLIHFLYGLDERAAVWGTSFLETLLFILI